MLDDTLPSLTIGYLILDDSLPWKSKRFLGFGFLVLRNVLCFQKIFGTHYQMSVSWFLIDMKFISKLLQMFLWKISLSDPHLHNCIWRTGYSKSIYKYFQKNNPTHNFHRKIKNVDRPFKKFEIVRNFRFSDMKIIFFKMNPWCFLYVLKYFCENWEGYGSRF